MIFFPRDPAERAWCEEQLVRAVCRRGSTPAGLARRAGRSRKHRHRRSRSRASDPADLHRPWRGHTARLFEWKLYVIRNRTDRVIIDSQLAQKKYLLRAESVVQDDHLQRTAAGRPGESFLPRSGRRAIRFGAGAGSSALQHEHVSDVGSRSSVPLPVPQRRDQYATRQHQLDARPREHAEEREVSAPTSRRSVPDLHAGGERLGDLRQRARTVGAHRPVAARGDVDADSRALGRTTRACPTTRRPTTSTRPA